MWELKKSKKLCNKFSMKVNLLVKFNRKNITLTTNLIFTKLKLWQIIKNFYKYPSKSINKILNDKPVYT